ncbi:unnamed protein product [Penicillium pancosmium]
MDPPDYKTNSADPTGRLPNYSIIHSPSFTFLVGPRHTKLTIQSALAQHVSKPLHNLMNNGHTRESRHRIAVLEEEDVETFVAFCEYAYTGDYKVPQAPAPREHRVSVAESVHSPVNSWRGTYRSSSMSSAVPPPAPSPPPEFVDNGLSKAETENIPQPQPELEPSSVIGEDPAAEGAAEAATEVEAGTGAEADTGVVEEDKAPVESAEEPAEKKDDQPDETQETEAEAGLSPLPEADEQAEPEPSNDADDWASWPTEDKTPKENSEVKGKKGKKKDKKKKKNQLAAEEDVPANLTPPTTPPTNPAEMHELSLDNATEEPAEPVDPVESIEPESVAEQPAEITSPEEGPAETSPAEAPAAEPEHAELEPPAEQDLEPVPETTTQSATPPQEEWEASNGDEQQANEVWAEPGDGDGDQDQPATNEPIDPPKPVIDMSFAKQPDASPRTPGMSLWDEFATLRYNDGHQATAPTTLNVDDSPTDLPYLTFHAKVYVFATRYLIPALAQLCLRKLHRDLVHLTFADTDGDLMDPYQDRAVLGGLAARQAPRVLDLIRYAYTKTTRLEPISPTSATQLRENELRRLVVHYAACKVKELARYHSAGDSEVATPSLRPIDGRVERGDEGAPKSLRSLLDMTPELASDLVYRMM